MNTFVTDTKVFTWNTELVMEELNEWRSWTKLIIKYCLPLVFTEVLTVVIGLLGPIVWSAISNAIKEIAFSITSFKKLLKLSCLMDAINCLFRFGQ